MKYIHKEISNTIAEIYKSKKQIRFLHKPILRNKEKKILGKVVDSSMVSSIGAYVRKFEKKIENFTKARHAICLSSGTSALHISLILSGVKENDEVLIPKFNFIASTNASLYLKAVPHFVDCSKKTLCIDLYKLERYLSKICIKKGKKTLNRETNRQIKACIPTYSFGHSFDIVKLKSICKKYNITLIEDSAEALGTFHKKKHVGTFGKFGILSFNGNKIITTGGGGAILTNDNFLAKKARHISNVSKVLKKFDTLHNQIGYNYKMTNLNAAIGYTQIDNLNKIINKKNQLNKYLIKRTKKYNEYFEIYKQYNDDNCNNWMQLLIIKNKKIKITELLNLLNKKNIQSKKSWPDIDKLDFLKKFPKMKIGKNDDFFSRIILLPSNDFEFLKNEK